MFEFLQQIDVKLYDRYLTLEKNIKAASNSFYDSFLDLQEHFLKSVIAENSIVVDPHDTCGALLKRPEVKELFLSKFGVDEKVYEKMGDYAKKANEHKHEKEKNIEDQTVANYMHVFYKVSSSYAATKGLTVPQFERKYFTDMFGSAAKIDERLGAVETVIKKLESKIQSGQVGAQAQQSNRQALGNFIVKAEKQYRWRGTKEQFKKDKTILVWVQVALIAVGLLSTAISSICLNLYSTFTLFENIVLLQMIFLLTYTLKAKKSISDCDLAKYSSEVFELNGDNIWRNTNKEKKGYKWFRIISYVSVAANIICIWTMGSGVIRIFATIFELAFLGLTIASVFTRINLYCMYCVIFISGFNASQTERVTLVYDITQNKLCTPEDYTFKDFI